MDFEKTSKILFPQLIGNWHCTWGTEKSACLFLGSGFQDVPKGMYCNESVHQTLAYFSHQFIFVSCGVSSSHSCRSIASKNDQGPDTSFCFWNAQVIHLWMSLCPSTLEPRWSFGWFWVAKADGSITVCRKQFFLQLDLDGNGALTKQDRVANVSRKRHQVVNMMITLWQSNIALKSPLCMYISIYLYIYISIYLYI